MTTLRKKISTWFDEHGLFALSLFLLVFIPLYPKIPLAEAIPGYLVRIRLEDLLVLGTSLVWFVQLLRKKIEWRTSFHFLIISYALIGLVSLIIAIGLQQTIPPYFVHLSKSILHYFRYLEYFSLFLIFHASIKNKQHIKIMLTTLVVVLNLIFIYGVGQRYMQFPAFSTMNREFSKGEALILAPTTKLHSTFGGHYDLAAYLVIILPIMSAWALRSKKLLMKLWLGVSILGGFWLLKETDSKISLAATLISIAGIFWYSLYQKWGLIKSSLISILTGVLVLGSVIGGLWMWQKPTLYKYAPFLRPAGYQTPVDVEGLLDETWSANARKYGLSMGIRLDTLWPNALNSFSTNPFTGKGYATLNKTGDEFVEADSTDNNFLRVLGETGLLGFIAFFSLIVLIIKTLLLKLPKNNLDQALTVGFIASTIGIFINALIIDVFSASKVAFTYWAIAGLTIKNYSLINKKIVTEKEKLRFINIHNWWKKFWPLVISGVFLILLVHKQPFTEYSLVKSFALSENQAKYVATTKCLFDSGSWTNCTDKYQLGTGLVYSLYLLPFYTLSHQPAIFYFANLILIIGSAVLLDSLIKKFTNSAIFRFLFLLIIFTTPSVYMLPTKSSPANLWLFLILLFINNFSFKTKPKSISKIINLGLLFITLVHLGLVQYFINMTSSILASFRDTYQPSSFVAIRRANRYLPGNNSIDHLEPTLLTTIEPALFDLYGKDGYQISPLTTENLATHKESLTQNPDQRLFITNANVTQTTNSQQAFEEYKNKFGIKLRDIDCRHECDYYELLTEEVIIPTQPESWNKDPLKTDKDNFSFLVINNEIVSDLGQPSYLSEIKKQTQQQIISQESDLIFVVGDTQEKREENSGKMFLQRLDPYIKAPIVSVLSHYNSQKHTNFGPRHQLFEVGENWFITLDAGYHHNNPAQNIFLYDTLLQLEKHPEIKNVFIISDNPEWLDKHPDNFWFADDFPKHLEKYNQVNFQIIF
ncbi:MAG: O-antigen ligase family protein, partial [Candidatus Pacebacteria bacterium]|nr:O-antigen ligase family protein [Candidatus Paceibacterota bacterium]